MIKANAYGHGAVETAFALQDHVQYFMVAEINEALLLRSNGIRTPVLIAGYTDHSYTQLLCENRLTQCVYSLDYAKKLNHSVPPSQRLLCHLKLDTGMGRLGFSCKENELPSLAQALLSLKGLEWEGVFAHFAHRKSS